MLLHYLGKLNIQFFCLLRCCPTFSKSLLVSVAVSKLGCFPLFFVEPGVTVDGRYYQDVLLKQQMLPVMRRIAGDTYVFQQDSAPAHRARNTVQLLQQETPESIAPDLWPPNSPDLNPVDYRVRGLMQERVYKTAVRDSWPQSAPHWDLVEHSADSHRRSHWRVGATTMSLRQSKGTSLRALADAVTNRLLSEPPNANTQQPALVRATHISSKNA